MITDNIVLTDNQKKLLEKFGVLLESKGWQPAVARVFGLLLIIEGNGITFDQVRETLNLSKSATSSAINTLLNTGKAEYITKTGDRKRYFRSRVVTISDMVEKEHKSRVDLTELLEDIYNDKSHKHSEFCKNLHESIDYLKFMNDEYPRIYQRWKNSRGQ